MFWLLVLAFVVFAVYAWYKYYDTTDPVQSKAKRMLAALSLAGASLVALVTSWVQGWVSP